MATITLSDLAPKEEIHFVFGDADFTLGGKNSSYETDSPQVVSNAAAHEWLAVSVPEGTSDPRPEDDPNYDPTDPHDNPSADHLSQMASPESIEAAAANEAAIQAEAYPDVPQQPAPTEAPVVEAPIPGPGDTPPVTVPTTDAVAPDDKTDQAPEPDEETKT